jgi:Zn-dependent M28 family amino/carboxypeptidase
MTRSLRTTPGPLCAGLLLMSLIAACAGGKRAPPPSTDIDEDLFRADVRVLASDEFEGRQPGTAGEDKTVAFLVAQYRKLGLKPGNGDSFLQQVPMVELLSGPDASLSVSGQNGTRSLAYKKDMVIWTKRIAAQAQITHSDLVFVGYGIVAPEYTWNDYADIDVRGKTVVVMVGDPGSTAGNAKIFKGRAMTYYGRWTYKLEEAARHGASGVLLIHDAGATSFDWDVVLKSRTGPQLELAAADANAGRAAIEGWLSGAASRGIFAQAGLDFASLAAAAGRPGFKPVPLGLSVDAEVHNTIRRFNSANVIGTLPGRKHSHEYIVYTAHWDHLGRAGPQSGDIYPGAVDNATGVAGLLALALSFKRTLPPPDRTIVFLALTGEESGLLGSAFYVENPIFPLSDTVADINMDTLQVGGPTRDVTVIGFGQSELEAYVRDAAALQGRELHADPHPEAGGYFRSDNFSFAKAGVPSLYVMAGADDSARGPAFGQAQIDDYYAHRYHQTGDRYAEEWDVRGMVEDLTLYYRVGMRLAQTRRFPNWFTTSEFRAARERSRDSSSD